MKTPIFIAPEIIAAALAGCASRPLAFLAPVGPAPAGPPHAAGKGQLVVYSQISLMQSTLNPVDSGRNFQTESTTSSKGSEFVRNVRRSEGFCSPEPVRARLIPREYHIQAQANIYPNVAVPVLIEAKRNTAVRLYGSAGDEISKAQTKEVQLAYGAVFGWGAMVKE